ncbi:extensin family protein [Roseibium sp.]|uniref:extensin-like domain-containing protein n=1 Tax=Roseibium sp. TaxID=1936156 RepID=UPI003D0C1E9A
MIVAAGSDEMQALIFLFCFCLLAVGAPAFGQEASPPAPSSKPLTPGTQDRFVEGVDLPRKKPDAELGKPVAPSVRKVTEQLCELPRVTFVQRPAIETDNGCGFENVVAVTKVGLKSGDEISFPGPVMITCEFAQVVADWIRQDVLPAARNELGMDVTGLLTGPGYQCRRRNNLPDGKLSEHALGKAVDVSGFRLANGEIISVMKDWPKPETAPGKFLRAIHAAACKRFTTVLGPDADPNHEAHFHLDTGCHGKDCTYLICQ